MTFLRVFQSVLHALEAASAIIAPIVNAVNPEIGGLMAQAAATAIVVEATVTAPGAEKAKIVQQSSQAAVDLTNQLLKSQGKAPLDSKLTDAIAGSTKIVVDTLNAAATAVDLQPAVAVK